MRAGGIGTLQHQLLPDDGLRPAKWSVDRIENEDVLAVKSASAVPCRVSKVYNTVPILATLK